MLMNDSIKRLLSRVCLRFAKLFIIPALLLTWATGAWAQTTTGYPVRVSAGEYITYYNESYNLKVEDVAAKLYTITDVSGSTVTATEITSADKKKAFLIFNSSTETKTFLLVQTDAVTNQSVYSGFRGTMSGGTLTASNTTSDKYVLNGKEFVWVKNNIHIGTNKAWLSVPASTSPAPTLTIVFDNTTGLSEELRVKSEEFATATWYDLNGRKLNKMPTRTGVYIQNGKKVVIR